MRGRIHGVDAAFEFSQTGQPSVIAPGIGTLSQGRFGKGDGRCIPRNSRERAHPLGAVADLAIGEERFPSKEPCCVLRRVASEKMDGCPTG